jgi:hypothetical protein
MNSFVTTEMDEATSLRSVRMRVPANVSVATYPVSESERTSNGVRTTTSSSPLAGATGAVSAGDVCAISPGDSIAASATILCRYCLFMFCSLGDYCRCVLQRQSGACRLCRSGGATKCGRFEEALDRRPLQEAIRRAATTTLAVALPGQSSGHTIRTNPLPCVYYPRASAPRLTRYSK